MFKQIYNREDGKPKLIESNEEGVFNFDKFIYTDIAPTSDLYEPMYFDGSEWIGSTKEEYEATLPGKEPYVPNISEIMLAQAQMQVTKTANQLMKSQKEQAALAMELVKKEQRLKKNEIIQAQTMKELTAKEQRLKDMEMQQAKTMLEITKLKGSN